MNLKKVFLPNLRWGHKGDSFREVVKLWAKEGLVETHQSPDRYVWMNEPGDVLLYDYDLVTDFGGLPTHNIGLFGNEVPKDTPNAFPWILWGRNPEILHTTFMEHPRVVPRKRMWESIFVGKVENQKQFENRFQTGINWSEHIQNFSVVKGVNTPYAYAVPDYLYNMARTKFAFLLPGYGPKCNRDIEACALGAVPIVTPGVAVDYWDEWKEGENFLRVQNESDIKKVKKTPDDVLEMIQKNNYAWYLKNCSPTGSYETTVGIIMESMSECNAETGS